MILALISKRGYCSLMRPWHCGLRMLGCCAIMMKLVNDDFATILQRLMLRARRRDVDLAHLAGIPARTIEKWRRGEVRHPRLVTDLLKVARALSLDTDDTTSLLQAAAYPSLDMLYQQAQQTGDH